MNRVLLILLVLLFSCKTTKSSLENNTATERVESADEQILFNKNDLLVWSSNALKQKDINLERLVYDTSKPPDADGNYPLQEKLTITDNSKEDLSSSAKNDISSDLTIDANKESADKTQENTTDKQEQNIQSKPQQWTKLVWAVVALLVVGFVIYKRIKK